MTDNWKRFSRAFKPTNAIIEARPMQKTPSVPSSPSVEPNAGATANEPNLQYWSAAQSTLLDELSLVEGNFNVVDASMPNGGTLMHFSPNNATLTFLSLNQLVAKDAEEFTEKVNNIRLPARIDLLYLWDAFLVFTPERLSRLLDILLPLLPIGGQVNFISQTSKAAPSKPGVFAFDSKENSIHWYGLDSVQEETATMANRDIMALLPNFEPKKLALIQLGYQDNLYIKMAN